MAQSPLLSTILRHPLASKRCLMVFNHDGEESKELFELLSRYEAVGPIGQGSYGFVCSARDNDLVETLEIDPPAEFEDASLTQEERDELYETYTLVAIKKLRKLFERNQPRMWLCATREIQLMMSFQHDNVMSALDFFIPLGGADTITYESIRNLQHTFDSVYVVMKKMDYTLREVLDSVQMQWTEVGPRYRSFHLQLLQRCRCPLKGGTTETRGGSTTPISSVNPSRITAGHDPADREGVEGPEPRRESLKEDGNRDAVPNLITAGASVGAYVTRSLNSQEEALHAARDSVVACTEESVEQAIIKDVQEEVAADAPVCCPLTQLLLHPLERDYRKFILYQIFCGVGYLHLCPVIHRDLKPENIMLDTSYRTCVTDFGQGRDVGLSSSAEYAQTVLDNCTQWYAAPETLTVGATTTTGFIDQDTFHGLDVWSIGCIAAEMMIGRPLFYTTAMGGRGQLLSIYHALGAPSAAAIDSIADYRDKQTRDFFIQYVSKLIAKAPRDDVMPTLEEMLHSPHGDEDEDEVNLIIDCLRWDPRERITIQAALQRPYFTKDGYTPVIDPKDTAKCVPSVRPEDISEPVSGRAFLWNLFLQRHPEVRELWRSLVAKHEEEVNSNALGHATQGPPEIDSP